MACNETISQAQNAKKKLPRNMGRMTFCEREKNEEAQRHLVHRFVRISTFPSLQLHYYAHLQDTNTEKNEED